VSRITEKHIKGQIAGADGKAEQALFFIAVVPPLDIQAEVTQLKEQVRDRYGSKHALNAPPHITLHMPFKWKLKKLDLLLKAMGKMAESCNAFEVRLKDFKAFPPRVIYIDVLQNEQLRSLHKHVYVVARRQLGLDNVDYKDRGFQPHMTIAFRDLKKSKFTDAWEDFSKRKFEAVFSAACVTLLRHQAGQWTVYQNFPIDS
jgi:2'-5' RNA ligase